MNSLFRKNWWEKFITEWNNSDTKSKLSNLGEIKFEFIDSDIPSIIIKWDKNGLASILRVNKNKKYNTFKADYENWISFINGEYNAIFGLLNGKITFEGFYPKILPFGFDFDLLAVISRKISLRD